MKLGRWIVALGAGVVASIGCGAASAGTAVQSQLEVQGLTKPVLVTHAPGDFGRLFIVEKDGRIRIFQNGVMNATPFLDIDPLTSSTSLEFGLLYLCFHPDYQANGVFYINYIDNTNKSVVAQCRRSASPRFRQPQTKGTVNPCLSTWWASSAGVRTSDSSM